MLPVRRFGAGPPLVALHGFTYTGRQFASLTEHLARTVYALDLPGHGGASHATTVWPAVLDDVASTVGASVGCILGYSQGARVALAGVASGMITPQHLVLISGTAGIGDETERRTRAESDRQTAIRILELGIDEFLDEWTGTGLTATDGLEPEARDLDLEIRRENTAEGLASALVGYGQGMMEPVWDRLDRVTCPTLVITGAEDEKYDAIGQQLTSGIPGSTHVRIGGAGHNPLLTHPGHVAGAVSAFLDGNG